MSTSDGVISPAAVAFNLFGQAIPYSTDAFNRIRASNPDTLFSSKQIYFDGTAVSFTGTTVNGGTSVYNQARASTLLSCTVAAGSRAVRQTKRYFDYQPGKSQLMFITFVATGGGVANVLKSIGYYDDNNGIFFRLNGTTPEMVVRSNVTGVVVDNNVTQASWNMDKMDGSGPSGITLDFSAAQILVIDFEWLGVGVVRTGWVVDGMIIYCHAFYHSNVISSVYMQTPNLPVRYEIVGFGAASSLEAICCSVTSEGGQQLVGTPLSANRGVSLKAISAANLEQVIAIRLRAAYNHAVVDFRTFDLVSTTASDIFWQLLLNPTVGGVAVWTPITNSAVEYDINLTAAASRVVAAPGTVLASGYVSGTGRSENLPNLGALSQIGTNFAGVSDVLSLCVRTLSGNSSVVASMNWVEPS